MLLLTQTVHIYQLRNLTLLKIKHLTDSNCSRLSRAIHKDL